MAELIRMRESDEDQAPLCLPPFLQREETAAQIVALMQARFTRPGPDEMRQIIKCVEQQITALQL